MRHMGPIPPAERDAYDELCGYTLMHPGLTFVHQHVVDAFAAQHATAQSKPIQLTFALVGLYLHCDRQFTGRQVQRAHMTLARRKRAWPAFVLPAERGRMTAVQVLGAPAGDERDRAIDAWCASVWAAYASAAPAVKSLLLEYDIV